MSSKDTKMDEPQIGGKIRMNFYGALRLSSVKGKVYYTPKKGKY